MTTSDGRVVGSTTVVDSGPPSRRWNLVLLGDGFREAELEGFAAAVQRFVDRLFASPPFDRLQAAVNVHRVDVASTDSGADDPVACGGTGAAPRTYFDATFCTAGIQRLLVVDDVTAFSVAGDAVPQWNMILVVVNSTIYGGSGGGVAVYSLAGGAEEIALHEMGHTAFGLADEYEYFAGCGVDTDRDRHPGFEPVEPNVTTDPHPATLKWHDLVRPGTPLPTTQNADCTQCDPQPNPLPAGTVGAYEGARYYHCGSYRPQFDCKMRALGLPFCVVCGRRIRQTLAPYLEEVAMPAQVAVTVTLSVLRRGSRGATVEKLQGVLNAVSDAGLAEDGDFGPRTDAAVRAFQRTRHLVDDGIVGRLTWRALLDELEGFAPIIVRQPQAFDIVDDPVDVCGIGTGFEATFHIRVRDADGAPLAETFVTAGGTGILGNFAIELAVGVVPSTPQGTLEAFERSADDGSEINKVVVPVTFGRALIDPYIGFAQYRVEPGDTLSSIAEQFYGDGSRFRILFEANRHQITDPDLIFPGQLLRVPQ
ncbi:MAG TPA: M64 family metallopeptidase [Acidimicrobiales bacterium]|nr:M64 family metallopeptidase [Acidimicrobiales bacterium]